MQEKIEKHEVYFQKLGLRENLALSQSNFVKQVEITVNHYALSFLGPK